MAVTDPFDRFLTELTEYERQRIDSREAKKQPPPVTDSDVLLALRQMDQEFPDVEEDESLRRYKETRKKFKALKQFLLFFSLKFVAFSALCIAFMRSLGTLKANYTDVFFILIGAFIFAFIPVKVLTRTMWSVREENLERRRYNGRNRNIHEKNFFEQ
jgi:hypothetical protein